MNQNGTKLFTASFTGKMYDVEAGMYYFNARWYDSELGRFITEDPVRDGIDWYAYCNNNLLRFVDLNGKEILAITSKQFQNSNNNKNLNIGSEQTGFYNKQNNYITNTVGRYGYLFVCAVNVGNSYNEANNQDYTEQSVENLAKNDSYFSFFLSRDVLGT